MFILVFGVISRFIPLGAYIALLVNLVLMIVLGVKGNDWTWRNKHWESVERFKKVQRRWAVWFLILLIIPVVGLAASVVLSALNTARQKGLQERQTQTSPQEQTVPAPQQTALTTKTINGITVSYPAGWSLTQQSSSFALAYTQNGDTEAIIQVTSAQLGATSFEAVVQQFLNGIPGKKGTLVSNTQTTFAGKQAERIVWEATNGKGVAIEYTTQLVNGGATLYLINYVANKDQQIGREAG